MEKNQICAVDVGYGRVKAMSGEKRADFPSLIADFRPIRFLSGMDQGVASDNLCVEYEGRSFFVGEIARRQATARATMGQDRFIQTEGMVLMLTALALLSNKSGEEVRLATGLPVSVYSSLKEDYRLNLLGYHSIRMLQADGNWGVDYTVKITDVRVIPQPVGTIFWSVLDEEGKLRENSLADKNLAVLDIGQHTVDLARMDALEFIDKESISFSDIGLFQVYQELAEELCRRYRVHIQPEYMEPVVREGCLWVGGYKKSIQAETERVFSMAAERIVSRVTNLWKDLWKINKVFVTGGGSLLLYDYLAEILGAGVPVELCENPLYTNCTGYLRYAVKRAQK